MTLRERGAQATINQNHLKHNLAKFREYHTGPIIAVVKADAYGHGLGNVVPAMASVDAFAVATIDEAIQLRQLSPNKRIILLEGVFNEEELDLALEHDFDVVVHQKYQMALLKRLVEKQVLRVWLKIDSGMNRLGFELDYAKTIIKELKLNPNVQLHLMSHFAQSDAPLALQTQHQMRCNEWLLAQRLPYSFSNTGAVLSGISQDKEWVRIGLGLFGISPIPGREAVDFQLKPVMSLSSKIIATKSIKQGQAVGYGAHFIASKDMRLGIVGIGYADGYPWTRSEESSVVLENQHCAIVGRVSMDMMAINLTALPETRTGVKVQLWGDLMPVETLAASIGVIPYTLVCGITKRVKFDVIE